ISEEFKNKSKNNFRAIRLTIMGIVTVETEPEETVKKPPKKETPPPTIIVTAEKVETIKPISEEFKNKSKNNFRAIRLD
ncbi:MAG TPA: hypothetical protein PLJ29_11505, partial [Leptospiraceae bacterium]|nr:hypothetical protein [Leptospiraceae bacterium]